MKAEDVLRLAETVRGACRTDPGLWNIVQAEHEWALFGAACDPLSPLAPERALKALQRSLYLSLWDAPLSRLAATARVLVAGGGTGRFAQVMAQRGFQTELVDISPTAVSHARSHLPSAVDVRVGDLTRPETIALGVYDAILAVEVACYATEPAPVMNHLAAGLARGGLLLFSVEARPGSLLADRDLASADAVRAVLDRGVVTLAGQKHVHYYDRAEAAQLATDAGLSVKAVEGVCYVPDGPFGGLVDASRLDDPEHIADLLDIEERCRTHPGLRELPRAWAVTAVRD